MPLVERCTSPCWAVGFLPETGGGFWGWFFFVGFPSKNWWTFSKWWKIFYKNWEGVGWNMRAITLTCSVSILFFCISLQQTNKQANKQASKQTNKQSDDYWWSTVWIEIWWHLKISDWMMIFESWNHQWNCADCMVYMFFSVSTSSLLFFSQADQRSNRIPNSVHFSTKRSLSNWDFLSRQQNKLKVMTSKKTNWSGTWKGTQKLVVPSGELTYPIKTHFWRLFSFCQGGIC